MPTPEEKGLETTQETLPTETAKETITAEERAELETLRKESELIKRDLKGKDSKITELSKVVKDKTTVEEQLKMKADEERAEWLADIAKTKAESLQLDDKHSALIKGSSKDEINASAELVKSLLDSVNQVKDKTIKALEDKIKILEANGTPPPAGNGGIAGKVEFTREELKDPANRKLYNETKGAYIKNE